MPTGTSWETESAATPMGQLAYFIEFLHLAELWPRWQETVASEQAEAA